MWWIYFNIGAERGSRHIADSDDPGKVARLAYTYLHLLLVAGIIVVAVGDELVLAHPTGHTDAKTAAVLIGGPALYLAGNLAVQARQRPAFSAVASGRAGAAGSAGPGGGRCEPAGAQQRHHARAHCRGRMGDAVVSAARGRADADTGSFAHSVLWRR